MKKILILLFILISNLTNAQCFDKNDSLFLRYANLHDKLYLDVFIEKNTNNFSINWLGDCDEIQIESNNGQYFPVIDCQKSSRLNLHNLSPGDYTIKFYCDDKLLKIETIKT